MQTKYYETSSFIRHQGRVVDLSAYREKLAAVSGESFFPWAPDVVPRCADDVRPELTLVEQSCTRISARRRRERQKVLAFWLEVCASASVVLFAITAMVQFFRVF